MSVQIKVAAFAVAILLAIVFLSFRFLSRRGRWILYSFILAPAIATYLYVLLNSNPSSQITLELVASGLHGPVQATWGPDNTDRFFVVGRNGVIQIMINSVLQESPFLDISQQVTSDGLEQGFLSAAFHPDFAQNGIFYVYYTKLDGDTTLVRYQTFPNKHDLANPDSALTLLTIDQIHPHHNGGTILFGPDGYLYLSLGDSDNYQNASSQSLSNYRGKILRLDISDLSVPYRIPPDNPFLNTPNALPEIWASGLRNPWRMAFDIRTGDLYIADVGEGAREEIDFQRAGEGAGANYGWPWFEGNITTDLENAGALDRSGFDFPITDYDHLSLGGCAVIGGDIYYGNLLPELPGKYLFGDFCYGYVWALEVTKDGRAKVETVLRDPAVQISAFATDGDGEMYILDAVTGNMYKLVRQ